MKIQAITDSLGLTRSELQFRENVRSGLFEEDLFAMGLSTFCIEEAAALRIEGAIKKDDLILRIRLLLFLQIW